MAPKLLNGPISNSRRKADLVEMAEAFGIDSKGTVHELVVRLKAYRDANEDRLSVDPRFQGIIHYRKGTQLHTQAESKTTNKTSADKTAEDIRESQKPAKAATG